MKKDVSITEGPIFKNLFLFTVPIILTGLLQLFYNAADLIVVGRYAENNSLAAVGSTTSFISMMTHLFLGLSSGVAVTVAHFIGAKEKDAAEKAVHTSIGVAVAAGFLLMAIGLLFSKSILTLMQTPADILDEAALYVKIIFIGMPASMVYNFGAAVLRAAGNTKTPLLILSISGIINVILNLFFVIFFNMGADGVGLATIISQYISAVLVVKHLMKPFEYFNLNIRKIRIHKNMFIRILKIGLPTGLCGVIFSFSNVIIQSSINGFGSSVISGNSAAANLEGFCYTAMISSQQSVMTFVAQNIGANRLDRIKKIIATTCAQVTLIGIVASSIIMLFAHPLLSLYVPGKETVISYGILRFKYILVPYFLCGVMEVIVGSLRGMGVSLSSMIISIMCVCGIRIVWIYTIFKKIGTLESLYISYPITWVITALIQLILLIFTYRRMIKNTTHI